MRLARATSIIALLAASVVVAACGSGQAGSSGDSTAPKRVTMDEQQAMKRADEIIHRAVDGMSPKPTLKRTGLRPVGACVADDHSAGERKQVTLSYQLTGVPGIEAKKLVRQARDAWVKLGYKFQSSDADWSDPFPSVSMRTVSDDFWMTAVTGVVDKAEHEGLAAISVTSPCFADADKDGAGPAAFRPTASDDQAERRALEYSSRIYDALGARHAPPQPGEGVATYQDADDRYAHHAWSTEPLVKETLVQVLERAQAHFERTGWTVRQVPTATGVPMLLARNAADGTVARLAPSTDGALRAAVTTPEVHPRSAGA